MVNLAPHHRRIRLRTMLIFFVLVPSAIIVPVTWIYIAYGACMDSASKLTLRVCSASHLVPLLPAFFGLGVLGVIGWELVRVGIKHHEEKHRVHVRQPRLVHALQGYRAIDERHRRHVHAAVLLVITVSIGLLTWLMVEGYRSTH